MIKDVQRWGRPSASEPRGTSPVGSPHRKSRIPEGGPGGDFLLVAGRRPRRGGSESSSVGRGLKVPSKPGGPPPLRRLGAAPSLIIDCHIFFITSSIVQVFLLEFKADGDVEDHRSWFLLAE